MELILTALPSILLTYLITRLEKVEAKINGLQIDVAVIKVNAPKRRGDSNNEN